MYFEVDVPVKNYLLVFLNKELGTDLKISPRNPLARIILSYLTVKYHKKLPKLEESQNYFKVLVPRQYFERYKVSTVTEAAKFELSDYFERYFTRLMLEWVYSRMVLKNNAEIMQILKTKEKKSLIQINASIREFLEHYEISEKDMPFETAKKRYQRLITKRKNKNYQGLQDFL